jgi:predicted Zn-dependent protease
MNLRFGLCLWILACLALAGCATNPVSGRQELALMSEQQEIAVGREAHQQILQRYKVYEDVQLQAYVQAVGQRLAEKSHRSHLSYHFSLLDSTEINAFALPGGYIYITRGLLAYMNSEAELAAVLGHELGHVTARHAVRQQSSAQAASIGAGVLSIFLPELRSTGLDQVVDLLGTALLRGYGREHELEADRLGAEYLARTGYDPNAMLDVIRTLKNHEQLDQQLARLEGRETQAYHGLFSTHPDNDTRLKEVVTHARQFSTGGGERYRNRFLDEIDGLVIGENPADGVIIEDRFYHPDLGFGLQFPRGWQAQNLPDRLILNAPQGGAQQQVSLAPLEKNVTPREFVGQLGLPGLTAAARIEPAGLPGLTGITRITSGKTTYDARLSVVLFRDFGYIFTGIARSTADLQRYDPSFLAVANSFHPLTEHERKQLEPRELRVVELSGPVSWSGLAAASPLKPLAEEQLRLLNGDWEGGPAPQTARLKVVK